MTEQKFYYKYSICETGSGGVFRVHGDNGGLLFDGEFYPKDNTLEGCKAEALEKLAKVSQTEKPKEGEKFMIRILEIRMSGMFDGDYILVQGETEWKHSR